MTEQTKNSLMEVLIVEDDAISRAMLKRMVEEMGHRAAVTENGLQAWTCIQERPIRMVITDWMMPEMDGLSLCQKIRNASLDRYVYIIMLTAKDAKKDLVEVLRSGADDYIPKPFDPDELRARVLTGLRVIDLEEKHRRMERTLVQSARENETRTKRLKTALERLQETRVQMVRSDKMSAAGRLAAEVADEIKNRPVFVSSNLKTISDYHQDIAAMIGKYQDLLATLQTHGLPERLGDEVRASIEGIRGFEKAIDIGFLLTAIADLISDCREMVEHIGRRDRPGDHISAARPDREPH